MNSESQVTINYPASLLNNPLFGEEYVKFLRSIEELSEQKITPSLQTGCKSPQSTMNSFREAVREAGRNMPRPIVHDSTSPVREKKPSPRIRRRKGPTLIREVPIVSPNTGFTPVYLGDVKDCPCYREDICPSSCSHRKEDFFEKEIFDELQVYAILSALKLLKETVISFLEKYVSKEQSEKIYSLLVEVLGIVSNRKLLSLNKIFKDVDVRLACFKVILN